jgi:hypothetical protein
MGCCRAVSLHRRLARTDFLIFPGAVPGAQKPPVSGYPAPMMIRSQTT